MRIALALLLPWCVGAVWVRRLWKTPLRTALPSVLGYGYVGGMVVTTLLMRVVDLLGFRQNVVAIGGLLCVLTVAGLVAPLGAPARPEGPAGQPATRLESWTFRLLLGLLVIRFVGFALEVIWRPLYPWDAWMNWAPKARVWLEHGRLVPFVSLADWVAQPGHAAYTLLNYEYPPTVPLIQLWVSLALGTWDESLINLPWVICGVALAAAFYGQLRQVGAPAAMAMGGTTLLLSLPMLGTHIALAGYADLWVATTLALSAMAFYRWARHDAEGQGATALLFAAGLPLLKAPGLGWALTLVPAALCARWRARPPSAVVAVLIGGASLFVLGAGRTLVPEARRFGFHPVWGAFAQNFFALGNWHLLWLATPVVLVLPVALRRVDRAYFALLTLLLAGGAFLFAAFFFTERYREATDFSTLNRAVLHLVPTVVFTLVVAWLRIAPASVRPEVTIP